MTGKHESPRRRRWWLRLPVVVTALMLVGLAAWALIAYLSTVSGSIVVGSPEIAFNTGVAPTTDNADCSASYVDMHNLAVDWSPAFESDTCQIVLAFSEADSTASQDMTLQDVVMPADVIGTTANCGLVINQGGSATPGATFTLEIGPGVAFGSTIDLSAGSYGLYFVDSPSYVAGNCPST